ncbi:MAG TPA: MFS transporter [Allosphingosinicella sp.]|nr:MFS transporter [Allosphingosinicella sp.]
MDQARTFPTAPARTRIGVLIACTMGNFVSITPAVTVVLSLFLIPISREFDWPRARVTGVIALLAIIAAIVVPIAGRLADRYGARRVILTGHVAFALSMLLLVFANGSVVQFYLIFTVIGIAGAVPIQPLYSKVIAEWFDEHRALALAIAGGVGNAVGSIAMPVAAGLLLSQYGWRHAYAGVGVIVLAIGFPTMFTLLKDAGPRRAEETDAPILPGATFEEAVRSRLFWIILTALVLGAGSLTAIFTHIVPLLTDRGLPLATATAVLSAAGVACAGWQILVGLILDRVRTARVLVPMFVAGICGLLLIQRADSTIMLLAGGVLIGVGLGSEYGGLPYLLSRYFGLRAYGAIVGAVFGPLILVQGIVPFLFDAGFDHFGSYHEATLAVALALATGASLLLALPRYSVAEPAIVHT